MVQTTQRTRTETFSEKDDRMHRFEGNTPEQIADQTNLPQQRALFDFDLSLRVRTVIGADPADLSNTPMEPVLSMVSAAAVVTVMAHPGQEQRVADILAQRPDLKGLVMSYAGSFQEEGVMDFAFHAHTPEEITRIQRALSERDRYRNRN